MNKIARLISDRDSFGISTGLTLNQDNQHKTICGDLCTSALRIAFIAIFIQSLIGIINR